MLSLALLLPLFALSSDVDACAASIGADRPYGFNDPRFLISTAWHVDAVVYARVLEIKHDLLGPYPTLVDLLVTSVQKGNVPGRIRVVLEGGPKYDPAQGTLYGIFVSHAPQFEAGEHVILFLVRGAADGEYHAYLAITVEENIGRTEIKNWWIREIERDVRRAVVAQETACREVSSWDPAFLSARQVEGRGLDAALLEQLRVELLMSDRARPLVLGLESHLAEIRRILSPIRL